MTSKKIDQLGAQPTDPPWARLVFLLVQGRDGQWWRAILLMMTLLILVIIFAVVVGMIAVLLPLSDLLSSIIGIGSLMTGGALMLYRRRRNPT